MLKSAKLRGPRHWKVYFLKLHKGVYLRAKFEASTIILTSLRHGGNLIIPPSPTSKRTPKKPTQIRFKGNNFTRWVAERKSNCWPHGFVLLLQKIKSWMRKTSSWYWKIKPCCNSLGLAARFFFFYILSFILKGALSRYGY